MKALKTFDVNISILQTEVAALCNCGTTHLMSHAFLL